MLKLVDSEFNAIDTIRLLSLSMIRASKILIQAKLWKNVKLYLAPVDLFNKTKGMKTYTIMV